MARADLECLKQLQDVLLSEEAGRDKKLQNLKDHCQDLFAENLRIETSNKVESHTLRHDAFAELQFSESLRERAGGRRPVRYVLMG